MQRVKLAASILVFLVVVAVFGYLFYEPIYGKQKVRHAILLALHDASAAAPDTNPQQFEPRVRMFNLLSDTADIIVEYRDRTTGESKFFRYTVNRSERGWEVGKREPFTPKPPAQ